MARLLRSNYVCKNGTRAQQPCPASTKRLAAAVSALSKAMGMHTGHSKQGQAVAEVDGSGPATGQHSGVDGVVGTGLASAVLSVLTAACYCQPADAAAIGFSQRAEVHHSIFPLAHILPNTDLFGVQLPLYMDLLGLVATNLLVIVGVIALLRGLLDSGEPVSVVKMQIGLLEKHPKLQSKLAQLSSMIQVGTTGAWVLLEEAVLEILKHQSSIAYADVSVEQLNSKKKGYSLFSQLAEVESQRASREEASAVQHHSGSTDTDTEDSCSPMPGILGRFGLQNCGPKSATDATVVTLVLACRGHLDIPQSGSSCWRDLRHALQQLAGLTSDRLMAVEVLWTPQAEGDFLTREQLRADYPNLLPLQREVPMQAQS